MIGFISNFNEIGKFQKRHFFNDYYYFDATHNNIMYTKK